MDAEDINAEEECLEASCDPQEKNASAFHGLRDETVAAKITVRWVKLRVAVGIHSKYKERLSVYENIRQHALSAIKEKNIIVNTSADSNVDVRHQGDLSLYSNENLILRAKVKRNPVLMLTISRFWSILDLYKTEDNALDEQAYKKLNRKMHIALIPNITEEEAMQSAQNDWNHDMEGKGDVMNFEQFFDSLFELADVWCEEISAVEYSTFLERVLDAVTNTCGNGLLFRSDDKIKRLLSDADMEEFVLSHDKEGSFSGQKSMQLAGSFKYSSSKRIHPSDGDTSRRRSSISFHTTKGWGRRSTSSFEDEKDDEEKNQQAKAAELLPFLEEKNNAVDPSEESAGSQESLQDQLLHTPESNDFSHCRKVKADPELPQAGIRAKSPERVVFDNVFDDLEQQSNTRQVMVDKRPIRVKHDTKYKVKTGAFSAATSQGDKKPKAATASRKSSITRRFPGELNPKQLEPLRHRQSQAVLDYLKEFDTPAASTPSSQVNRKLPKMKQEDVFSLTLLDQDRPKSAVTQHRNKMFTNGNIQFGPRKKIEAAGKKPTRLKKKGGQQDHRNFHQTLRPKQAEIAFFVAD